MNLNSLRDDGGQALSEPKLTRWVARRPRNSIEGTVEDTARDLTPILLSEAVFQTQGQPFKAKLRASLSIDSLARELRDEFRDRYERGNSRHNQLLDTAVMYKGILSIINIMVALFLGLTNVGSSSANGDLQKLGQALWHWMPLTGIYLRSISDRSNSGIFGYVG